MCRGSADFKVKLGFGAAVLCGVRCLLAFGESTPICLVSSNAFHRSRT